MAAMGQYQPSSLSLPDRLESAKSGRLLVPILFDRISISAHDSEGHHNEPDDENRVADRCARVRVYRPRRESD
jgi:hypothetical protein